MIINPDNPEQLARFLKERQLILYGMGTIGKAIALWCDSRQIEYIFADRDNIEKQKTTDKIIIAPEGVKANCAEANIVISSNIYFDDIKERLLEDGFDEKQIISYNLFLQKNIVWADLEDSIDWDLMKPSVELFSKWIGIETGSVVDYGAGQMYLKRFLRSDVQYFPVDYIRRFDETIVCDLNTGIFPELRTDAAICNGVLEFLVTPDELLKHICKMTSRIIIISYMTVDKFPNIDGRRTSGYVSDLTECNILDVLAQGGFQLAQKVPDPLDATDTIYLFERE